MTNMILKSDNDVNDRNNIIGFSFSGDWGFWGVGRVLLFALF